MKLNIKKSLSLALASMSLLLPSVSAVPPKPASAVPPKPASAVISKLSEVDLCNDKQRQEYIKELCESCNPRCVDDRFGKHLHLELSLANQYALRDAINKLDTFYVLYLFWNFINYVRSGGKCFEADTKELIERWFDNLRSCARVPNIEFKNCKKEDGTTYDSEEVRKLVFRYAFVEYKWEMGRKYSEGAYVVPEGQNTELSISLHFHKAGLMYPWRNPTFVNDYPLEGYTVSVDRDGEIEWRNRNGDTRYFTQDKLKDFHWGPTSESGSGSVGLHIEQATLPDVGKFHEQIISCTDEDKIHEMCLNYAYEIYKTYLASVEELPCMAFVMTQKGAEKLMSDISSLKEEKFKKADLYVMFYFLNLCFSEGKDPHAETEHVIEYWLDFFKKNRINMPCFQGVKSFDELINKDRTICTSVVKISDTIIFEIRAGEYKPFGCGDSLNFQVLMKDRERGNWE